MKRSLGISDMHAFSTPSPIDRIPYKLLIMRSSSLLVSVCVDVAYVVN